MVENFFDLETVTPEGRPYLFSEHRGRVVLVVNTATRCGLTPQFEGLEALHQKYRARGLVVVGFPCDQFAHQEPLSDDEMVESCRVNHGVSFPLMAKSDVNGPNANSVFQFLKARSQGSPGEDIAWNFGKFLVSRDGVTVRRYEPTTVPADLEGDLLELLG